MIIMKANAKEYLGKFMCLSITKAKAKTNPQIFICNRFCVDGIVRGISAILARYPMNTRQMGAIPPSAILSRKGYCAIWGGISHWAAKIPRLVLSCH